MIDKQFADLPPEYRRLVPEAKEVLQISPTADCPKGTRGRTAVFEALSMDKELEQVILKNPAEAEVRRVARKQGMFTMKEDAIFKALRKEIPWEEVNKL